jgi:TonB family protein
MAASLAGRSTPGATPTFHARIAVGTSFVFSQERRSAAAAPEHSRVPRITADYISRTGLMAFSMKHVQSLIVPESSGGAVEATTHVDVGTVLYFLDSGACVVDVLNGIALMSGAGCDQPLPKEGSWTVSLPLAKMNSNLNYQNNKTAICSVTRADTQKTTVPAGSFDTVEIACALPDDSKGHAVSATYWYARDIGIMVKCSTRATDSSSNEVWSTTEELQAYEPPDQEVAVSPDRPTPSGTWRYRQFRGAYAVACGPVGAAECVTTTLRVDNASSDTLECKGQLTYDGTDGENRSSVTALAVVLPKQHWAIVKDRAKPAISVISAAAECTVRAKRVRLDTPQECKFHVLHAPKLEEFYPPAAQRLGEQGPVDVAFKLESAQGQASDMRVVGSSLSERLDKAAIEYIASATFSTPCPSTRYEIRVSFQLVE